MKTTKVTFNRKFNIGNYQTIDVGGEIELGEKDNMLEAWTIGIDNAEMWHLDYQRKMEKKQETPKLEPPLEKGIIIDLETLVWQEMPATDKGAWQKSETRNASYYAVKKAIEAKDGKPAYMEGYIIWLNSDDTLGRRKK